MFTMGWLDPELPKDHPVCWLTHSGYRYQKIRAGPWKDSFSSGKKSNHYLTTFILIYSPTFYPIFRGALILVYLLACRKPSQDLPTLCGQNWLSRRQPIIVQCHPPFANTNKTLLALGLQPQVINLNFANPMLFGIVQYLIVLDSTNQMILRKNFY